MYVWSMQPFLFFTLLVGYKLAKHTRLRTIGDMSDVWFVKDSGEDAAEAPKKRGRKRRNRFYEFLSWVK